MPRFMPEIKYLSNFNTLECNDSIRFAYHTLLYGFITVNFQNNLLEIGSVHFMSYKKASRGAPRQLSATFGFIVDLSSDIEVI